MDLDLVQTIATVVATIAAIAAIVFGYYQFRNQMHNADALAHANIKPLLDIERFDLDDKKSISLINHGIGSAVIISIVFYKSDPKSGTGDLSQLVNLGYQYDQVINYLDGWNYIKPGGVDVLSLITKEYLKSKNTNITEQETNDALGKWTNIMRGIKIYVIYQDVLGERQKNLDKPLFI